MRLILIVDRCFDHRSRFVLSIEFFLFIVDDGWIHHLRLILVVDHCSDLGWLFV